MVKDRPYNVVEAGGNGSDDDADVIGFGDIPGCCQCAQCDVTQHQSGPFIDGRGTGAAPPGSREGLLRRL
jgi:hypothetical protein